MPVYFSDFPIINYDMNKDGTSFLMTDITKRFKLLDEVLENISIFYDYTVMDGDTPSIVSDKFYGTIDYDWLILMANKYFDPYFDWPMSYEEFNRYLEKKYGSIYTIQTQIARYERIIQPREILFDGTIVEERVLVVDQATYLSLPASERRAITVYDDEYSKNEARREIKVPNSIYLNQIKSEKEKIFNVNG